MEKRIVRNFEIKELIATGGMAAIYKAIQISLEREVAIKILHGHLAQDKDFITRFEREAKAAANLKHENIVNIIDFGKAEDNYFIAMEYVEGKSLKDLINSVKFIPPDIALMIAHEMSQGLAHAHHKGVVHRDIKPANVLIGYDGSVKIADFGLAQAQDLTSITVTGAIVGTPAYMSPEQAGGKKVDSRSDLFSLGVVIYEMITGIKPFRGANYSSIIHEILTVVPPTPIEANPLVPRDISAIIERMLVKDPEQRLQHAADVGSEIVAYQRRMKIETGRKDIGVFIKSPNEQFEALLQKRKDKHFERGLYYLSLGDDKIDDATGEFDKILLLDPGDAQAAKYLAELKERGARRKKTRAPVKAREKEAKPPEKKKPGRRSVLPFVAGSVMTLLVIMILGAIFLKPGTGGKGESPVFGYVKVSSTPAGAEINIDGRKLNQTTPALIDSLSKGKHAIELKKDGYQSRAGEVEVAAGDTALFEIALTREVAGKSLGRVNITSTPAGATVYLDNVALNRRTPCTVDSVAVGVHRFRFSKPGYETVELERRIVAGQPLALKVTMTAAGKPAEGAAYLKVTVSPWAKIFIDDRYIETTPLAGLIKVAAGSHEVKLENPDFKLWQKKYVFKTDQTITINVNLERLEGYLKLTVKPWADVYIDGKKFETTPIAYPIKLASGRHVLKLVNPDLKVFEETIEIHANQTLKKHVELVPKWH